jgi:hypothetical protein
MKKKVGIYDILDSGTIVGNVDEPVDFIIDEIADFTVRLKFINDTGTDKYTRQAEKFGAKGVQLVFTNYNNSLGTGTVSPLKIGSFNKRELYINYRIYHLEGTGKLIHYTWLLGKEASNG